MERPHHSGFSVVALSASVRVCLDSARTPGLDARPYAAGIVVTSGRIDDFNTPQTDVRPMPPDPAQNAVPDSTFQWDHPPKLSPDGDSASLVFAFTSLLSQQISFRYVFASTELPWFMGAQYNDDLKMLVNGNNIAVLPSGMQVRPSCSSRP
jgi:hypothetical protein